MMPLKKMRSANKFIYAHIFHLNKSIPTYLKIVKKVGIDLFKISNC